MNEHAKIVWQEYITRKNEKEQMAVIVPILETMLSKGHGIAIQARLLNGFIQDAITTAKEEERTKIRLYQ